MIDFIDNLKNKYIFANIPLQLEANKQKILKFFEKSIKNEMKFKKKKFCSKDNRGTIKKSTNST